MVSTRQMTTTITGPSGSGMVPAVAEDLIFDGTTASATDSPANMAPARFTAPGTATNLPMNAFAPSRSASNATTKYQPANSQVLAHSSQLNSMYATLPNVCHIPFGNGFTTATDSHAEVFRRQQQLSAPPKQLLDMPVEILDKIFSHTGYRKVAQMRLVSQQMNVVCSSVLNSTFQKLQTQLQNRFTHIKRNMPRRESSRRLHPLSFECDIVETCYMRLSLLQMTFGKHIDRKHICFFAGAILDEVYNTLNVIRVTPHTGRHHTITEELYDLSTMAMEYFKEHLEPSLPAIVHFIDFNCKPNLKSKYLFDTPTPSTRKSTGGSSAHSSSVPSPPQSNMVLRKGIRKIKQGMKRYNNQLTVLRNDLRFCKKKSTEQNKQITEMQKLLAEQQKQTLEYAARLNENDKKNEEMSMKISTLLQEANKCKTELQYWRSKSTATPTLVGNEVPVAPYDHNEQQHTFVDASAIGDSSSQQLQLAANEFTGDFGVIVAGGCTMHAIDTTSAVTGTGNTNTTTAADTLGEQHTQIDHTLMSGVPFSASVAIVVHGDVSKCGAGAVAGRPLDMAATQRGDADLDAVAHVSNSVICSVGLPATVVGTASTTTTKSNAKRRLDVDNAVGVAAAGNSAASTGTGGSPSDMKKARRVQNKASRCTTSNVITSSKITRSK